MLSKITDVFLNDDGTKKIDIPRMVTELISIKHLRKEFIDLYDSTGLNKFLFEGFRNWRGFMGQILKEICHKPIVFPDDIQEKRNKKAKKIYDEMIEKAGGREMLIARKLWLSDEVEGERKGDVYWCVQSTPKSQIRSRLLFEEEKTDFAFE
jgi:hypothetical protein